MTPTISDVVPAEGALTVRRIGVALLLLAGIWLCSRLIPYTLDDAFIYFRYADNVAHGLGPVFNRGDAPVEGFTSPAWMLGLAAVARVLGGESLQAVATVFGLVCYLGCVLLLVRGSRRDNESPAAALVALVPAALWCLSAGAVFYSVTGLETPAFVLIVLLVHGALAGTVPRTVGLVAAGAALWTRPEGGWLVVAGAVQLLVLADWQRARRLGLPLLLALIAGAALLVALRWRIFHELLPNTYYAKRPKIPVGLSYVTAAIRTPFVAALLVAGGLGAILGERRDRAIAAASAAWIGAAILEGGDWMPHARLLQPALALAALASAGLVRPIKRGLGAPALAVGAVAMGLVSITAWSAVGTGHEASDALGTVVDEQRTLDRWMKGTGVRSVALMDIGETGFELPDVSIIDLDGLTDARIGHTPGGHLGKLFDLGYLFDERRPDMIVIRIIRLPQRDASHQLVIGYVDGMSLIEGTILADPRLQSDYERVFVQTPQGLRYPLYGRAIYVRRGFALPPEARPALDMGFLSDPSAKT